ncbi:MAG: thioredoxin family protein [Aureliella sp.]
MVHVALAFLLAVTAGGTSAPDYETALAESQQESKPLVVLIGAPWCASCQIMKRETIEPMLASGKLANAVVTFINKDERPELAHQLMKGETLPQIVVFSKRAGGWKRFSLTGMQSQNRMAELLDRATTAETLR